MKFSDKKVMSDIIPRLTKKAAQSPCNFFIAAAAFSKKGNLLGSVCNNHNPHLFAVRKGAGMHAESQLIRKFGNKIDTIYLIRIGRDMNRLPIHPCVNCQKLIDKFDIKIILIHIEFGYKSTDVYP